MQGKNNHVLVTMQGKNNHVDTFFALHSQQYIVVLLKQSVISLTLPGITITVLYHQHCISLSTDHYFFGGKKTGEMTNF